MVKSIIQKISTILRELFAFLRVTVTLQLGRAKVSKDNSQSSNEETGQKGDEV